MGCAGCGYHVKHVKRSSLTTAVRRYGPSAGRGWLPNTAGSVLGTRSQILRGGFALQPCREAPGYLAHPAV